MIVSSSVAPRGRVGRFTFEGKAQRQGEVSRVAEGIVLRRWGDSRGQAIGGIVVAEASLERHIDAGGAEVQSQLLTQTKGDATVLLPVDVGVATC